MFVITRVVDSRGELIPSASTSYDNTLVLSGTGPVGGVAFIESNGVTIVMIAADAAGNWSVTLMVSVGRFSFIAVDFGGEESPPWKITISDPPTPCITLITDAAPTLIPEGGIAIGDTVTLSGTGAANRRVEIFDGSTSIGSVVATNGYWTLQLTGLATGIHRFMVVGEGGSPVSPTRTLTVIGIGAGTHDFGTSAPGVLPLLTPIEYPSGLVITVLKNQPVDPAYRVNISPNPQPHVPGGRLNLTHETVIEFKWNNAAHSAMYRWELGAAQRSRVKYFNPRGRELGSHSLPVTGDFGYEFFTAPPGEFISSMRMHMVNHSPTGPVFNVFSITLIQWTLISRLEDDPIDIQLQEMAQPGGHTI